MEFNDEVMHKVWAYEQDILDVIHKVCEENHLKYSLFYGTLIGAVRHGGFIPWDDDIDLAMPRIDYEKFRECWFAHPVEGYILQDYYTDVDYTNNFMKIRKDHTTFVQTEREKLKKYHKGIFVDIFPLDRLAPTKMKRKIQYFESAVNLLYSRGFQSGTGGVIGTIEKILLTVPSNLQTKFKYKSEKKITQWNNNDSEYFSNCTINTCHNYYSPDIFDQIKKISFNGKEYFSVLDTDSVLRVEYGDYMELPPEEERVWKHHPLIIDFNHNYEELSN